MSTVTWSNVEGSTDEYDTASNSTVALSTSVVESSSNPTVSSPMVAAVGLIVMIIGILANSVVLAVLVRARRQFGSSVHTLIANQSSMDLFTCLFGMISLVMMLTRSFDYSGHKNKIRDSAVCVLFDGGALVALGLTAEIIGLMVITVERYFKIVHAIAHRKYYRNWMTKVGVALPWIGGACLMLFPAMGTTRIVNGRCIRMGAWPTDGMAKAFAVVRFLWHYAIPMSVFAFCYGRIFHSIRRKSNVVNIQLGRSQEVNVATVTGVQTTGQVQQQATGASTGTKLSHTELSVLQTMTAVVVLFVVCWSVPAISNLLTLLGFASLDRNAFVLAGSLAFTSFSINPFIYASRYEVFRRYLKQMLTKGAITPGNTGGTTNASQLVTIPR